MPTQKITRTKLPGALKAHAILIAINRYDKIGAHLQTPRADAEALKEALITYQGFAEENVHTCYDPTKAELETFLADIQQGGTIKPKDGLPPCSPQTTRIYPAGLLTSLEMGEKSN